MKQLIKKSIVLALLFTALQGSANVNPMLINLREGNTAVLILSDVEEGDKLFIKDIYGHVLYQDSIWSDGGFVREFNLTVFEKGSYYFEFSHNNEVEKLSFRITNNKVELRNDDISVSDKKTKRAKKNGLFNKKHSSSEKPVKIEKAPDGSITSFKGQDFANYFKSRK